MLRYAVLKIEHIDLGLGEQRIEKDSMLSRFPAGPSFALSILCEVL